MAAHGRETAPRSLLRRTGWTALLAIAASLAATHYLASRTAGTSGAVASLRGVGEPETTGSIAGSAARTRLDPCAVPLRP